MSTLHHGINVAADEAVRRSAGGFSASARWRIIGAPRTAAPGGGEIDAGIVPTAPDLPPFTPAERPWATSNACKDGARPVDGGQKAAGVPTARNGPPERIPTCDWDAGVSEHEKEKNRMFVRGLLTPEAEGLAIVRTPNGSLAILLYVVKLWHMALTTGVDVAARPGGVGALGSFAVDAGRFGAQQARARAV